MKCQLQGLPRPQYLDAGVSIVRQKTGPSSDTLLARATGLAHTIPFVVEDAFDAPHEEELHEDAVHEVHNEAKVRAEDL